MKTYYFIRLFVFYYYHIFSLILYLILSMLFYFFSILSCSYCVYESLRFIGFSLYVKFTVVSKFPCLVISCFNFLVSCLLCFAFSFMSSVLLSWLVWPVPRCPDVSNSLIPKSISVWCFCFGLLSLFMEDTARYSPTDIRPILAICWSNTVGV